MAIETTPATGRWAALGLTALALVLALMTWFSATAVIPDLTRDLGLSPGQAAWLTNGVQLGFVIGALASSLLSLADVWALTRVMAVAAVIAGLANAALLLAVGPGGAIGLRIVTGVALALIYPPAMKFIATWFVAGRGIAIGVMVGALTLGSALPHLVRGLGGALPWQWVIGVSSAGCLVAVLIFLLALREGPHAFARTRVDPRQIGAVIRDRAVMLANLGYFGHMWELYALWGWILAYVSAAETPDWAVPSLLAFAVVALGAPSCVIAGALAERIGRCRVTAGAMAISGICALTIGFAYDGPFWLLALIAGIWGLTVVADSAQFSTAVTELADQRLVGSALAFQTGVGFLITIVSIATVRWIAEATGSWQWSFLVLVPGPMIGVWAMLRLRARPEAVRIAGGKG